MSQAHTLTFVIMDPPFETARSTTFFRLIKEAIEQNCNVNVFAYEGGVALSSERQRPHGNGIHGRDVQQENHPLPKDWVSSLMRVAKEKKLTFRWINCGLCADERGIDLAVEGAERGSPADFYRLSEASDNILVIPTR